MPPKLQPGKKHKRKNKKKQKDVSSARESGLSSATSDRGGTPTITLSSQSAQPSSATSSKTSQASAQPQPQPPHQSPTTGQAMVNAYYAQQGRQGPPRLDDLPRDRWWKLFIDKKHHGLENAETYYDRDQSHGYSDAMKMVFREVLLRDGDYFRRWLDAEHYRFLHKGVTKGVSIGEGGQQWSEHTDNRETSFGAYNWDDWDTNPSAYGIQSGDVSNAIKEMKDEGLIYTLEDRLSEEEKREIGVRLIQASGTMSAAYGKGESAMRVQKILDRYNDDMDRAKTRHEALSAIARAVRALHVGHFFRDANGRLNMYVVLNKLLTDEGFSPVILPYGPEVFGGMKTVDELVKDIEDGMRAFQDEVRDAGGG